jgi:LysR family transcriptional regulator of gallate degradation
MSIQDKSTEAKNPAASTLGDQLHNLRVFSIVAEYESIAVAAKQLFKAPSAVSRSVIDLEKVLGLSLFERNARGILLNDFGRIVQVRAERIDAELRLAAAELSRQKGRQNGLSPGATTQLLYSGRKLNLVIQLCQNRKLSTAAQKLGVTQSGASMALTRLEAALGAPLFHRGAQGMIATDAANRLVMRAQRVFAELRHMVSDLASTLGSPTGTVIIGTLPLGRTFVFPMAVADAIRRFPGLRVRTIDSPFGDLLNGLRSGSIDAIIGVPRDPAQTEGVVVEPLFEDRLTVVVRRDHPLVDAGAVSLEALKDSQWILPWTNSPSRWAFEECYRKLDLTPPEPVVETADLAVLRQLLLESDSVALASARQLLFELRSGQLVELPVKMEGMTRQVGLLLREGAYLSAPVLEVLDALRRQITE